MSRHDIPVELSEIGKIVKELGKRPKHGSISAATVAGLTAKALEEIERRLKPLESLERRVTALEGKMRRQNPARPR